MRSLKALPLLILGILILTALLFFPIGAPSSSVFYVSLLFLSVALVLSTPHRKMGEALSYLRLRPQARGLPYLLGWGLLTFAASGLLTAFISASLSYLGMLDTAQVQEKLLSLSLPALIVAFTLAPLAEEALFRGFLFRKISEWKYGKKGQAGFAAGAVISSAVFAAFHLSYSSVAELAVAFSIGMLFCLATHRAKSLVPAVVAHASFNFISIFFAVWLP